ncbi:hypothetical protein BDK51DRAFT_35149 [Blyttiomyces helicus]|uniref:Sacsin/Nov domain-containing protein n=1 Tax=Blyttiomyces helicus TaxID=388810 RepID=A0A4P9W3N8_9FUNG|nr:hypothetical protein BDK51DRAFT_35149 [Blyttiomyces helicus]|eukprot:RKO86939.1 hypothetical protein BDK51DRAFT_35149 [Blyttiomyces helicus]
MNNLQSLKDALVADRSAEEKVEVNQRHLIDKILARYSAEFTVFRELLQNSNDAGAKRVQIIFEAEALKKGGALMVKNITFRNNGRAFSEEDWRRLRKIAEGNPDEEKTWGRLGGWMEGIGHRVLGGDMLYTKRGKNPDESQSEWTSFFLNLREPIDIPGSSEFGRFIATSLGFTATLRRVEVLVNNERILSLHKKAAEPRPLSFTKSDYTLASPNRIFALDAVSIRHVQLDVEIRTGFDFAKNRPGVLDELKVFMRIAGATLQVSLNSTVAKEMERTTKKRPPSSTPMQIMFSNYNEYESSSGIREKKVALFDDLIPARSSQGRVFIGFPTHQTTGCAIQLAAHLIPTVERESIDFVDRTLANWNQELLCMGGLLARIVYDDDMAATQRLYSEMILDVEAETWLHKCGAHTSREGAVLNEGCAVMKATHSARAVLARVALIGDDNELLDAGLVGYGHAFQLPVSEPPLKERNNLGKGYPVRCPSSINTSLSSILLLQKLSTLLEHYRGDDGSLFYEGAHRRVREADVVEWEDA